MSQDLFENMDVDDPEPMTQLEFSGISASGSTISQHTPEPSQEVPVPVIPVVLPGPSTSTADDSAYCQICKKPFKSIRGLKTHLTRSHKGQQNVSPGPPNQPNPLPLPSAPQVSTYPCPDCQEILKSKHGFLKHRASHKLRDIYKKMPSPMDFHDHVDETMMAILSEILMEPSYGSPKHSFVQALINSKESDGWKNFSKFMCDFICGMVCQAPSKLLPANQYEGFQKQLNAFLCKNDIEICEKLLSVQQEVEISGSLASRLNFRIASKLLQKIQVWALRRMKLQEPAVDSTPSEKTMTDQEKSGFLVTLAETFQSYFKKAASKYPQQCESLKTHFVDGQHPISRSQFLDKKNWFSGEEFNISPSNRATSFFLALELNIIPIVASISEVTTYSVIEKVFESPTLLNDWYYLTNDFLCEDSSLAFMRDLVRVFVRSSQLLEEKKKNRGEQRAIRATQVALRTHLQTNASEKDDCNEDVV